MAVTINFVCEIDKEAHLYVHQAGKQIKICICERDEAEDDHVYNSVI
jgi:hypothetical protein